MIGSYLLSYSPESHAWQSRGNTTVAVDPIWDDSELDSLAKNQDHLIAWQKELLVRANRTGQTLGPFGDESQFDLPPDSPATPSSPNGHTYVATASTYLYSMPFSIRCGASNATVTGSVTAPAYGDFVMELYRCDRPASSDRARIALGFCP